jgi:hypothetical protein
MASRRSVDFLPSIFQTPTNRQFLAATLDQLTQEPNFARREGFIGRSVGPGVNPDDRYIIEPDRIRADYQLETGVVSLAEDAATIKNVMTYPGLADAVSTNGGNGARPDRLYESQFYSWDPFVDFDTFVNFSQYYWLPNGPDAVSVQSDGIASSATFTVTRENGVYKFSGVSGSNPRIQLLRNGNYNFVVAQNEKETVNYRVRNVSTAAYQIDGQSNPTLTLARGNTYVFNLTLRGDYPFWIKTAETLGTADTYNTGVSRNGSVSGLVTFVVPQDAPDTLYYVSQNQSNMRGVLQIVDGESGTGSGFWIQTSPGVAGTIPATPNISNRDVYGVTNNGEDLGVVNFAVPTRTAQEFYFNLATLTSPVDLVTGLKFNQINNIPVSEFIAEHGGIDGITALSGRTLVFAETPLGTEAGGWERTTLFDPLDRDDSLNGQEGSFDSIAFDQATEIPVADRYQVYQITTIDLNGVLYLQCNRVADIAQLTRFTVRYGNQYSSTSWYKNTVGIIERVPLLTAQFDTLYYQDGTDPAIFGEIQIIDAEDSETLFVDRDIVGAQQYTSPNGVVFTNGLKVTFRGAVEPASYGSGNFVFSCTAANPEFDTLTTASTAQLYPGQQVVFTAPTIGGLEAGQIYYVRDIINDFEFTLSAVPSGSLLPLQQGQSIGMLGTAINYREYYVTGVGTGPGIESRVGFIDGEAYFGPFHVRQGQKMTGAVHQLTFHQFIYNSREESLRNFGRGAPAGSAAVDNIITGTNGIGIRLVPVENFVCPESYVVDGDESTVATEPGEPDYFTIDRGSLSRNAWSRSNRWFHLDVINATAAYNNTVPDPDVNFQARRPILQFRPNLRLFNMGVLGIDPVDIIDLDQTDAFSNVQGAISYSVDGYQFTNGSRVIFAADEDPQVRNRVYVVEFVYPDSQLPLIAQPIINLVEDRDGTIQANQCTVILEGTDLQGITFWYDGTEWIQAQQKTSIQQAPRFDVYDADGISYGNNTRYPSTDFTGTPLFSYARGSSGVLDPILRVPLRYLSIANVGDIVFDNNLYVDSFTYTLDNISTTQAISDGTPREYQYRTDFVPRLGWQTAVTDTKDYQQFKFIYDGRDLELDIPVIDQATSTVPVLKVYATSRFVDPAQYSVTVAVDSTAITLVAGVAVGEIVEVLALSRSSSRVGFYQVPINLENNPLNENAGVFTLGTVRQHYQSLCENLPDITGRIIGQNNSRDLGNIVPFGIQIVQQSSPLTLASYFMRSADFDIFAALRYNGREYFKFKNLILEQVTQQTISFQTAAQILDTAIDTLTQGRTQADPFYWSDMLPSGAVYTDIAYTVSFITTTTFDMSSVYDYTSANYRGVNVYLNDSILTRGLDYVVATDGPRITVLTTLTVGDRIMIREYANTAGSYVPNTPTKIGAYPAWRPEIITVDTSSGQQTVIVGHDGSQTITFGDIRDDVLLEFETRIFNNLKLDGNPVPITAADVIPGQFRDTGYSYQEITSILEDDFLNYVAWNKLDYSEQQYQANNAFSFNYSRSQNRLDNQNLLGAWRGINRFFYDTQQPALTPWQMLGFSIKPDWWDSTYGVAPYTSGNMVLWDDIAQGIVRDPAGEYVLPQYARPDIEAVIPVGTQGELLPPLATVTGFYDTNTFRRSWAVGDGGPVESSWWNSSLYPFAVMRLLALTRPAKFFALLADRDRYRFDSRFAQFLYDGRYRLDANGVAVYGDGVSKASYINWLVDYNRLTGLDSTRILTQDLANLDVRLCYRMAGFSDKRLIQIYTEKTTPDSTNTSLLIPDSSYDLLLYKNTPFARAEYSAVMVQRTDTGYQVFGYSTARPFFQILRSQAAGRLEALTVAGITARVPANTTQTVLNVPYGFEFTDRTSVCDFLLSYGRFLETQGFTFDAVDNGYQLTWTQMAYEFLYWSQQGWGTTAILNLNPLAGRLTVSRDRAVVDNIDTKTSERLVLDQNRRELPIKNLNISRIDNTITLEPTTNQTISYAGLEYTSFEHMIVLQNRSEFGDLIYSPVNGARQDRLRLQATVTAEWNGTVNSPGFVLNQPNVEEWTGLRVYTRGEIVRYKNSFWSAARIVQPSATFNSNDWLQSDYEQIEQGLLPNLALKSDQLAGTYEVNRANLEADQDLFSYGLIGFRPRQYLAALNLGDVSQLNVYRQFLGNKGTQRATDLFRQADFGKEAADYQIYENWALQRAVYGASANRTFVELRLDRALLAANPSLVQVVQPQQTSIADQAILLSNVWRQSQRLSNTDIFPTTLDTPPDIALPGAGYVNVDDVDVTVFDLGEPGGLDGVLDEIVKGTQIWVAKVNDYDWNIYRAESVTPVLQHVCDNLDQTSLMIFQGQHGLAVNDTIIVREFDAEINGVYQVLTVPALDRITVAFSFAGSRTSANATGIVFYLQTQRVAQFSDAIDLPYITQQNTPDVYVDNDGTGRWAVYERRKVLTPNSEISPEILDATEQYGSSIAVSQNRFAALVGSPRYGFGTGVEQGAVYTYVKNFSDTFQPVSPVASGDALLTLDVTGVRGYGTAVTFGNTDWAAAGAPGSLGSASQARNGLVGVIYRDADSYLPDTNPYRNWQILTANVAHDQGELGAAMAMSRDERWLYVGAPGVNEVYAYARVDWQDQKIRAIGNGTRTTYSIQDVIQISAATQLQVTYDGVVQIPGVDWTVDASFSVVTLAAAPVTGTQIEIQRLNLVALDSATYLDVTATGGTGSGAEFTVVIRRNTATILVQSGGTGYTAGETLTIAGSVFAASGWSSPANNITFTINTSITNPDVISSVNAPTYTGPGITDTFNLGALFFQVALSTSTIESFSIETGAVLLRPNIDYTFDTATKEITFVNSPAAGASILARAQGYWQFVDVLSVPGMTVASTITSNTIGIGAKTFVTQTDLGYVPNQSLRVSSNDSNYMDGVVTSYDGSTGALVLVVGAVAGSGTYADWKITPQDQFGAAVATTTDGSGVIVGAPDRVVAGVERAGALYYFDRSVQRFIYGQDPSSVTFTVLGSVTAPVAVRVNGNFLVNQDSATVNAPNTFTVSGNLVTINADLEAGDVIEIDTNQFVLTQTVTAETVETFGVFGTDLDICYNNCSLYVGSPGSSEFIYRGGKVERFVNQARRYGIIVSTRSNPVLTAGDTIRVNNQEVAVPAAPNNTLIGLATAIDAEVPNVAAVASNGRITISVANSASATPRELVTVAPGAVGTAFFDLGFDTFVFTQEIASSRPLALAGFGNTVTVNSTADQLAVGASRDNMVIIAVWDDSATDWDLGATDFFSVSIDSGSVYLYDLVAATNGSITNPDRLLFGQAVEIAGLEGLDALGTAIAYEGGLLWMGAPGSDIGDSSSANYGQVYVWENATRAPAWQIKHRQQPTIDIRLLNSVFLYDRIASSTVEYLDFFNPQQGKILGAARQNLDYIGAQDPASYNTGPVRTIGTTWGVDHVGEMWWDTSRARFIDPNQDSIIYTARRWSQLFTGSRVDVYQWTESTRPPANYVGPGTPLSSLSYVVNTQLNRQGVIETRYYFWVQGVTEVATRRGKSLSAETVARYIEDPRSTGIAYLAPINASTVALYNCQSLIQAQDTILHVEYDQQVTNENVHAEWELVAEGRAEDFVTDGLYRKLQDSLCGVDTAGNSVPDIFLSPPERYGVQFRPRQSMFVDRFAALQNYIDRSNAVLAQFPISEIRLFNLLNSQEPTPGSDTGSWDRQVANLEILGFQNIYAVPVGYRYLVLTDSSQRGLWSIYTVVFTEGSQVDSTANRSLMLSRVQNYRTPDYWSYRDWYAAGFDPATRPVLEVVNFAALETLTLPIGSTVKVTANSQGKFEIYRLDGTGWTRVGLQDGTILISSELYNYAQGRFGFDLEVFDAQYFDQEPVIETRKIIQAINQELLIDDLLIERNRLLTLMFDYTLTEQQAPGWITKTSLIDVDHRIRELIPFQNYNRDNQEFVLDYLQEVKPYHVQIREFGLEYFGSDIYLGDVADFDVPAYFDTDLLVPGYVSPILLPYQASVAQASNTLSDAAASDPIWQSWPWNQWYANYLLTIDSIEITHGGSGYTQPPQVTIQGDADTAATASARINTAGAVIEITLLTPGSGYRDQPQVIFSGGNGVGAQAYVRLVGTGSAQNYSTNIATIVPQTYNLTRTMRTVMRYDRYQYQTSIETWSPDGTYDNGSLVRYENSVWRAANSDGSSANVGPTFRLEDWQPVPASTLSGVDRTMGYYVSPVTGAGLELQQLITGVVYPGVEVWADYFTGNVVLDTEYSSAFTDTFLGTRVTDITVDGGEFVGIAEGHAPEELVNGSEFDTLDLRVYTRPGSDWQEDGHGFQIKTVNQQYNAATDPEVSWANLVEYPFQVLVANQTTQRQMVDFVDYQIDWETQTVFVEPGGGISDGDQISVQVFELGGGSQLYRNTYASEDLATARFLVPVNAAEIQSIAVFIDGVPALPAVTWTAYIASVDWNIVNNYTLNSVVNNAGNYYRSIQPVPAGTAITDTVYWLQFAPTLLSEVDIQVPPPLGTLVSASVFGFVTTPANEIITGREYTITEVGTTNWTSIGAASNTVGVTFTATGPDSGTGTATSDYSWSTPVVQTHEANATTQAQSGFTLENDIGGTNVANMIVNRNGLRLSPPAGIEWQGDGTSVSFGLPQRLGLSFLQSSINAITDIQVWVDNVAQAQSFGSFIGDFSVTPWSGSNTPGRQVVFAQAPRDGAQILISVSTLAGYTVAGDFLELVATPNIGDVYQVITWNDTSQQELITQVFYGPTTTGIVIEEGFDSTGFDSGSSTGGPGSFDYSAGSTFFSNNFELGDSESDREFTAGRMWVTLDDQRLFEGQDYLVINNEVILASGAIGIGQVLAVTAFSDSIVPEAAEFRIFQDMRGQQVTYRMTADTQTTLAQTLSATDAIIYVTDAGQLSAPDLARGIFGSITVDGERITYSELDLAVNSVGGLRRGAFGTGAADHAVGAAVYDIGEGNALAEQFQDQLVFDTTLTDGSTSEFVAPSIRIQNFGDSSSIYVETIQVFVAGAEQLPVSKLVDGVTCDYPYIVTDAGGDDTDLTIEFVLPGDPLLTPNPPPVDQQVRIQQRIGTWWYDVSTVAAQQQSLQENTGQAARFLTDRIGV